ncbi:uncharacterized protein WM277_008060 [Molossus nigricans]
MLSDRSRATASGRLFPWIRRPTSAEPRDHGGYCFRQGGARSRRLRFPPGARSDSPARCRSSRSAGRDRGRDRAGAARPGAHAARSFRRRRPSRARRSPRGLTEAQRRRAGECAAGPAAAAAGARGEAGRRLELSSRRRPERADPAPHVRPPRPRRGHARGGPAACAGPAGGGARSRGARAAGPGPRGRRLPGGVSGPARPERTERRLRERDAGPVSRSRNPSVGAASEPFHRGTSRAPSRADLRLPASSPAERTPGLMLSEDLFHGKG